MERNVINRSEYTSMFIIDWKKKLKDYYEKVMNDVKIKFKIVILSSNCFETYFLKRTCRLYFFIKQIHGWKSIINQLYRILCCRIKNHK